jgi:hypothetical protein
MNNDIISSKKDLILSDDFEKAVESASDIRKSLLTSVKTRNRDNFDRFYDIMVTGNRHIQDILDKRAKDRTDTEKQELKDFKSGLKKSYKLVVDILSQGNDVEEGEQTIVQKMVEKISSVIFILKYLGNDELYHEFGNKGIKVSFDTLEEQNSVFENENIRKNIEEVFETGKKLKDEVDSGKQAITETIYSTSVPEELQYDKSSNPCGIKPTDFARLVDVKTKLIMAFDDEAKDKVKDQANLLAEDKEFEIARNRIIQSKLEMYSIDKNSDESGQSGS